MTSVGVEVVSGGVQENEMPPMETHYALEIYNMLHSAHRLALQQMFAVGLRQGSHVFGVLLVGFLQVVCSWDR